MMWRERIKIRLSEFHYEKEREACEKLCKSKSKRDLEKYLFEQEEKLHCLEHGFAGQVFAIVLSGIALEIALLNIPAALMSFQASFPDAWENEENVNQMANQLQSIADNYHVLIIMITAILLIIGLWAIVNVLDYCKSHSRCKLAILCAKERLEKKSKRGSH